MPLFRVQSKSLRARKIPWGGGGGEAVQKRGNFRGGGGRLLEVFLEAFRGSW